MSDKLPLLLFFAAVIEGWVSVRSNIGRGLLLPFTLCIASLILLSCRIEHMVESAHYFVVMPGTLGTLTELCAVWSKATLATEVSSSEYCDESLARLPSLTEFNRVLPVRNCAGQMTPIRCGASEPLLPSRRRALLSLRRRSWLQGHYRPPRIFAYRKPWEEVIVAAVKGLGIPPDFAAHVHYVENADEAVAAILADAAADAAAAAAPEGGASAMPTGSV